MSKRIPEGWVEKPLSALAHYHNGRAFKPEDWSSEGLPIIRIAQITNINAEFDHYAGDDVSDKNRIVNGDLLFSWSATLTALIWNRGDAVLNQHIFKVEEKEGIDRKYLHQVILNSIDPLADYSHGSTMKHIKKGVLDEYCVAIPDLPEQQKIAAILSSVDDVIEKTRAQIDKLKDLKTGMMQELLTKGIGHTEFKDSPVGRIPESWAIVQLGEVCKVQGGYAFKSMDASNDGCRWLKIANVGVGKVLWDQKSFLPNEFLLKYKSFVIHSGDIVLALTRPIISGQLKVARATDADSPSLLNQRVARIIPNEKAVSGDFLFVLFSWEKLAADIDEEIFGTDPPNVSTKQIESISYAIPPLEEQIRISGLILSIFNRINTVSMKMEQLRSLKKALMQDLLTGKVRVNVD